MLREAIATGETVEQAFENACVQLGVETVDAEFEVLELPEKKKLGLFGGKPAKVLPVEHVSLVADFVELVLFSSTAVAGAGTGGPTIWPPPLLLCGGQLRRIVFLDAGTQAHVADALGDKLVHIETLCDIARCEAHRLAV